MQDVSVGTKGYMDLSNRIGFGVELIRNVEKKFPWAEGRICSPNL
jgi:hypothetical protein